jgi:hypothetical protein
MAKKMKIKALYILVLPFLFASSCEDPPVVDYTSIEGFYSCNESSSHSGYRNYIVEIDEVNSQENTYIIANFHNLGDNDFLYAEYLNDTLYIKNQVINTIFVNGKGKVSDDFKQVNLYYETDDGVVELDYYATYQR